MNLLLLQIVLARAARLTAREGALVIALAGVHAGVARKVAAGGKGAVAGVADMAPLWGGDGGRSRGWLGRGGGIRLGEEESGGWVWVGIGVAWGGGLERGEGVAVARD